MAYVNERPLAFDTNDDSNIIQDTSIQLMFDFKNVLKNPTVKNFEDTDISMRGMILNTPPNNQKVLEFNGKEYIYNYLAFTREGDIISELSTLDDNEKINKMFSAVMVLSDPHYIEKLYIIHPIVEVEGIGVQSENRELVTVLLNQLSSSNLVKNDPNFSKSVDMEYDLNKFIPQKYHFLYQYRTPTNNVSTFVVVEPSLSEFNLTTSDYTNLNNHLLGSRVVPDNLIKSTSGQIYKMTKIAKRVVQETPKNDENILNDQIYIDCQPITDRDNKVHIMDPIRLHSTDMKSFFALNTNYGAIYRLIICIIVFLLCCDTLYKRLYNGIKDNSDLVLVIVSFLFSCIFAGFIIINIVILHEK